MKLLLGSLVLLLCAAGIAFLFFRSGRRPQGGASYVCVDCGRRERHEYLDRELVSTIVEDDGSVFLQRFGALLPPNHAHEWASKGCVFDGNSIALVQGFGVAWVRILPELSDRAGADALFREAIALTPERRRELIASFEGGLLGGKGTIDEAFARWNEKRHSR